MELERYRFLTVRDGWVCAPDVLGPYRAAEGPRPPPLARTWTKWGPTTGKCTERPPGALFPVQPVISQYRLPRRMRMSQSFLFADQSFRPTSNIVVHRCWPYWSCSSVSPFDVQRRRLVTGDPPRRCWYTPAGSPPPATFSNLPPEPPNRSNASAPAFDPHLIIAEQIVQQGKTLLLHCFGTCRSGGLGREGVGLRIIVRLVVFWVTLARVCV